MVSEYHSKIVSTIADIEESPLHNFAKVLRNNLWIIEQRAYSSLEVLRAEVRVLRVVPAEDGKYKLLMTGYDALGKVDIKAVLGVSRDEMEMKFVKEYDDYCEYVSSQLWL